MRKMKTTVPITDDYCCFFVFRIFKSNFYYKLLQTQSDLNYIFGRYFDKFINKSIKFECKRNLNIFFDIVVS